jgi:Uma2 family endonuclease
MSSLRTVVPHLLPGQRLTRDEFLRRWEALPELKSAELIDGIVYMPSPVSSLHRKFDMLIHGWLSVYAAATPGCEAGSNGTWLMLEGAPQPDADLRILPEYGGQSRVEGAYCAGAPELAVEVCASPATYDFGPKLALYQRAGVQEYLTLSLEPLEVVWRELSGGRYVPLPADPGGLLRSRVFPGLRLDAQALLSANGSRLLEQLRSGIGSEEHTAFVERLAARRKA